MIIEKNKLISIDSEDIRDGTVIIPLNVTIIGTNALAGHNLVEIDIPESVIAIEAFAFTSNKLSEVIIPKSVLTIESQAFYNNRINEVDIPVIANLSMDAFDSDTIIKRVQSESLDENSDVSAKNGSKIWVYVESLDKEIQVTVSYSNGSKKYVDFNNGQEFSSEDAEEI